jgi:hypothetical protein
MAAEENLRMKVKFSTWHSCGHILAILAIPIIILDVSDPYWWTSIDSGIAFGMLCILAGVLPFLFWAKIIKIKFIFSEKDKKKMSYKYWKLYCEMFGRSLSEGSKHAKSDP